ncbi:MAG: CoA transferase [Alphaproteobacteria bacterium]|nr:MAG: CoA transferase [Alphaproteobacteria bacterium]
MLARALAGVRVLDLSQYLPGPYAAQILADLGAEVVKVEPPAGDPMRALGPIDDDGISAFYKLVNDGKTVVRLDLKMASGRALFARLLERADVLIESFRPGTLARLGCDAAMLRKRHPRLIHCALSGFGQTGPYAARAGHDITYMALGGGLGVSGDEKAPVPGYPPVADFAGAMQAALTVLAALLRRNADGAGCFLDVSLTETVLAWQGLVLTGTMRGMPWGRRAAALLGGGAACYRVYETADGRFVALGALEPKFWAAFCRAVGRPEWIARHGEPLPQSDLIAQVAALMATRPRDDWVRTLADVDCCFEPVLDPQEVLEHPQIAARGLLRPVPGASPRVAVAFPAFCDGTAPPDRAEVQTRRVEEVIAAWQRDRDPGQ